MSLLEYDRTLLVGEVFDCPSIRTLEDRIMREEDKTGNGVISKSEKIYKMVSGGSFDLNYLKAADKLLMLAFELLDFRTNIDPKLLTDECGAFTKIRRCLNLASEADSGEGILIEVLEILETLLDKNRKYGDSAINPIRLFSDSDSREQIRVRIDDKLNRLKQGGPDEDEDIVLDLIGYLILYRLAD